MTPAEKAAEQMRGVCHCDGCNRLTNERAAIIQQAIDEAVADKDREIVALRKVLDQKHSDEHLQHIHILEREACITGDPNDYDENDPQSHNCDFMGCPSLDHVLYRLPFTDHRKPIDVESVAKELAESIDFTSGPVQAHDLFKQMLTRELAKIPTRKV